MRPVMAAAAAAVLLGAVTAPLALADITPPEGTTPVVGMAVVDGSLWLAGTQADSGVLVNADDGTEVSFDAGLESVQALASHEGRLWVGDIGDPQASRSSIKAYRLDSLAGGRATYQSYEFAYPDGAQDAQAMAISGRGRFYFVTTGANPGIYVSELELSRQRVNRLSYMQEAPPGVTDAVFLADGGTLVLRTAQGIEVFNAWESRTTVQQTIVGAPEGESITADANNQLYVGGAPTIREGAVPSADSTITLEPPPEASPSAAEPSVAPSPIAEEPAAVVEEDTESPSTLGTMIALGAAGAVALLAGIIAFSVRG